MPSGAVMLRASNLFDFKACAASGVNYESIPVEISAVVTAYAFDIGKFGSVGILSVGNVDHACRDDRAMPGLDQPGARSVIVQADDFDGGKAAGIAGKRCKRRGKGEGKGEDVGAHGGNRGALRDSKCRQTKGARK